MTQPYSPPGTPPPPTVQPFYAPPMPPPVRDQYYLPPPPPPPAPYYQGVGPQPPPPPPPLPGYGYSAAPYDSYAHYSSPPPPQPPVYVPPVYVPPVYVPPPGSTVGPNPGDWTAEGAMRWDPVPQQWLTPNFFHDLDPVYIPPPPYPEQSASTETTLPPPPTELGVVPPGQTALYLPEGYYDFVPESERAAYAASVDSYLTSLGYVGMGDIGLYGERSYSYPVGVSQPYFAPESFDYIGDPYLEDMMQYMFGELGMSVRIEMPSPPPV